MPDDPTPPPLPRPVIPIEPPLPATDGRPGGDEVLEDERVPEVPMAGAEGRDMGAQAFALGLPSPSVLSPPPPPTNPPPLYPPPAATYPPPASYPPPAAYPPPAPYPPLASYPPQGAYPPVWTPPVDYRTAGVGAYARPGFVTAFAVFAIITAALSFLASAFTGCSSAIMLGNAQRGTTAIRMGRAMPTTGPAAPTPASPNGLSPGDVSVVGVVLRNRAARGMAAARQRQVEAFFAEHGKLVIDDPAGLTSRKVYESLGQTGQEYANPAATGAHFFDFKAAPLVKTPGRLRVFDDRAAFEPEDHGPTLRSVAAATAGATDPLTGEEFADNGLDDAGANAVINQIRTDSQNTLTPGQAATIRATLQSPSYSVWVTPSSTAPGLAAQVRSVVARQDGSMTITFVTARVTLDKDGRVIEGPAGSPVAASTQPAAAGGGGILFGSISVSPTGCALAVGEAALSALLAIFLLIVAILALRQSAGVRRLYLIYAVAKLILGVIAIVAFSRIIGSLSAGTDAYGYAQSMARGFSGVARVALVVTAIGMVFPLVLLLAMTLNRSVKAYYRTSA